MEKRNWWEVILEEIEKLIPKIKDFDEKKFEIASLGTILQSSILEEKEKQTVVAKLKEFSTKLSSDNLNENITHYYLIGLVFTLESS